MKTINGSSGRQPRLVRTASWLAVCWLLSAGGCAKDDRLAVVPVSGVVLYNGQPVDGADVIFVGNAEQPAAVAKTDSNGAFRLTTYVENDGAVPGEYMVMVTKFEGGSPAPPPSEPFDAVADMEEAARSKTQTAPARSLLPQKYSTAANSGLQYTISATGENKVKIELTD